ncbi:conserved hypothetical protein [Azospirillaceae bacterium]
MKVAFLRGNGFIDCLIKMYTFSKYSHCELLFGDNMWFGSAPDGNMETGFRTKYMLGIERFWDFIELPMTAEEEKKIADWCATEVGCAYDWKGIFLSQILPFGKESPDKWFCSEICVAALQQVGKLNGLKPHKVSPGRLNKILRSGKI